MNILIIGYGKMGRMIEQVAQNRGHNIVGKVDINDSLQEVDPSKIDLAIEFTTPQSVIKNIEICMQKGIPLVVGTTGWHDKLDEVKTLVNQHDGSLFYSTNFAIGVYLFRQVNMHLANLMQNHPNYEASMCEIHHIHKLDAPSGTAITLAKELMENNKNKTCWVLGEKQEDNQLQITAIREGEEFGTHIVTYESEEDIIEIKHKAKSRQGLALGAVLAAEYLQNRKGIYSMNDLMQ